MLACNAGDGKPGNKKKDPPVGDSAVVEDTDPDVWEAGAPPVNLLMITIDTTRRDRLNSNGYTGRVTSPNIDGLLAGGLALRKHHSCSTWTYPSFLCMLTGRDQVTLDFVPSNSKNGDVGTGPWEGDDLPSIANILHDEGFATGLVWANGFLGPQRNMDQGHETEETGGGANVISDKAMARMDLLVEDGRPWFLHTHFNDPHGMYNPPDEYLEGYDDLAPCFDFDLTDRDNFKQMEASWPNFSEEEKAACTERLSFRYDACIRWVDDRIALLLDNLDAHGQREETLIVFGTDHGEEFGEHGTWEHGKAPFTQINASTIGFIYPPRIQAGDFTGLTTHEDVLPTILDLMDLEPPGVITGRIVGAGERQVAHALVYKGQDTWQAVITPEDKLVYHWEGDKYYFDRASDPDDLNNLYDPSDPRVLALWDELQPKVDEFEAYIDDAAPIDPGP